MPGGGGGGNGDGGGGDGAGGVEEAPGQRDSDLDTTLLSVSDIISVYINALRHLLSACDGQRELWAHLVINQGKRMYSA